MQLKQYKLEKPTIAKVIHLIDLLEEFEKDLSMPHSKRIQNNICELRIRGQQEVRILYTFYAEKIILVNGFIKKTQKIPKKELERTIKRIKKLAKI